jgi:hypothetical protein
VKELGAAAGYMLAGKGKDHVQYWAFRCCMENIKVVCTAFINAFNSLVASG